MCGCRQDSEMIIFIYSNLLLFIIHFSVQIIAQRLKKTSHQELLQIREQECRILYYLDTLYHLDMFYHLDILYHLDMLYYLEKSYCKYVNRNVDCLCFHSMLELPSAFDSKKSVIVDFFYIVIFSGTSSGRG